jgi:hypothetical protein
MSNQVTWMKKENDCADTNCYKMVTSGPKIVASAHSVRASSLVALVPLLLSFAFFKS